MSERGVARDEVIQTVTNGRRSLAKFGRTRFRSTFPFNSIWNKKYYATKQIDAFAARKPYGWFVITLIAKYF